MQEKSWLLKYLRGTRGSGGISEHELPPSPRADHARGRETDESGAAGGTQRCAEYSRIKAASQARKRRSVSRVGGSPALRHSRLPTIASPNAATAIRWTSISVSARSSPAPDGAAAT